MRQRIFELGSSRRQLQVPLHTPKKHLDSFARASRQGLANKAMDDVYVKNIQRTCADFLAWPDADVKLRLFAGERRDVREIALCTEEMTGGARIVLDGNKPDEFDIIMQPHLYLPKLAQKRDDVRIVCVLHVGRDAYAPGVSLRKLPPIEYRSPPVHWRRCVLEWQKCWMSWPGWVRENSPLICLQPEENLAFAAAVGDELPTAFKETWPRRLTDGAVAAGGAGTAGVLGGDVRGCVLALRSDVA